MAQRGRTKHRRVVFLICYEVKKANVKKVSPGQRRPLFDNGLEGITKGEEFRRSRMDFPPLMGYQVAIQHFQRLL